MTSTPNKPRDPLVGVTLDGRFLVEELIGSGGMSNVYRATQLRVNRDVAIKTLKVHVDQPVYRERFQREVDLLCALSHPNIVTVYDCLLGPDGQPCVVMDYLRGRSLEQLLIDEGPLSTDRFATIFVQVLSALEHAHKKGVIHRDIKPGNIVMLDRETDFVKVVDFGLAKFNQESRRLTHTGELWGSPPYMSPEQCMGKPDSERSDLYSVGIVMYEMLTGKDPYHHATSIFELIQCHVNRPPPAIRDINPLANVPPKLEEILFKALAKDSECRYQSANTLKEDIVGACLTASDAAPLGAAAWAAAGGSISAGGISGGTYDANSKASDSPWYGGAPGTASGAGTTGGTGYSTAGDVVGEVGSHDRPDQSVSPWSREAAARNGGTSSSESSDALSNSGLAGSLNSGSSQRLPRPDSGGGSGGFGAAKLLEECSICGKPIQKQRRGSMTAWILADHHKVMEKISGFCECSVPGVTAAAGVTIADEMQKAAPRQNASGDTAVHMAKILARQNSQPSVETSPTTQTAVNNQGSQRIEPLFEDPNRHAGRSSMRYSGDRVTAAGIMGNQIVVIVFSLLLIGGLVFGVMQMLSGISPSTAKHEQKSAETTAPAAESKSSEDKTEAATVTKTPVKAATSNDDTKTAKQPEIPKKAPVKRPPKTAIKKHGLTATAKKPAKPAAPKGDRWSLLRPSQP